MQRLSMLTKRAALRFGKYCLLQRQPAFIYQHCSDNKDKQLQNRLHKIKLFLFTTVNTLN